MRAFSIRSFGLLAAAILLIGQGAALHHQHEIAADCPPGACLEHGAHVGDDGARGHAVSAADHCPFCDLLGHARAGATPAAPAITPISETATRLRPAVPADAGAPAPGVAHARAPPRLA